MALGVYDDASRPGHGADCKNGSELTVKFCRDVPVWRCFRWAVLKRYRRSAAAGPGAKIHFGDNVFQPLLLENRERTV